MGRIGSWEFDAVAARMTWSETACAILGFRFPGADERYEDFLAAVHPGDRAAVAEAYQESVRGGDAGCIEHRVVRRDDGVVRLVRSCWAHHRDESGRVVRSVGMLEDVTSRERGRQVSPQDDAESRRAQRALAEALERYASLEQNIPGMVFSYAHHPDGSFSFPYVSDGSRKLFGIEPEDLMRDGSLLADLIHPDDRERRDTSLSDSAAMLTPWRQELRHVINGEVRWHDFMSRPTLQPNGDIVWGGIALESTERRRAEAAARESDRVWRTLVANLPGFVYRCRNDRDWTMEYLGGQFEETTGYSREDVIDNRVLSYNDLIVEEHRELLWLRWQEALRKREPLQTEYTIRTRDGSVRWVWEQGRGVFDDAGNLAALEGFICDISERKKLEAQLRQSQKMEAVGRLAGGVAHDFNNILTAVMGNVALAMDAAREALGPEHSVLRSLEQIEDAAERASALTRQLLTFGRRDVMQPRVLDLNRVLTGLDEMLRRLIAENVTLEMAPAPQLHAVRADPAHLEQVIVNLVVNASQAMPDGGRLKLETRDVVVDEVFAAASSELRPGAYVLLVVSDTGEGMDAATRERIFEPFFSTKPMDKGSGLGLATVHGIVKQSGGCIVVYSEVGRGSAFNVYLPAVEDVAVAAPPAVRTSATPGGRETILLCEDDDAVRGLVAGALRGAGYVVLAANGGKEGLATAEAHSAPIDLLITDVIMPDMNGRALREQLAEKRPEIRALFISGYTADVIAHHGVLNEGVEFLQKPFTREGLLNKVRDVLAQADA